MGIIVGEESLTLLQRGGLGTQLKFSPRFLSGFKKTCRERGGRDERRKVSKWSARGIGVVRETQKSGQNSMRGHRTAL